jgi:hypothetical protein
MDTNSGRYNQTPSLLMEVKELTATRGMYPMNAMPGQEHDKDNRHMTTYNYV